MRTHLAVSLGAALFGIISTLGFREFQQPAGDTNVRIDVTRVASQVVVLVVLVVLGVLRVRRDWVRRRFTRSTREAMVRVSRSVQDPEFRDD